MTFLPLNEENDDLKEELHEHFPSMDFHLGGLGYDMNLSRDFALEGWHQ